jgi:hypothetical protein
MLLLSSTDGDTSESNNRTALAVCSSRQARKNETGIIKDCKRDITYICAFRCVRKMA